MELLFVYALLFTIGLCMLQALLLLAYKRHTHQGNRFLAGFLIMSSLFGLLHFVIAYSNSPVLIAAFYGHTSILLYLPGPMAYWYVRSVLTNNSRLKRSDGWHLLPAGIQVLNVWRFTVSQSWESRVELGRKIVADVNEVVAINHYFPIPVAVSFVLRPLLMLVYGLACWRLWLRHRHQLRSLVYAPQFQITRRWLLLFITLVCILAAAYLGFNTGFVGKADGIEFDLLVMAMAVSVVAFLLLSLSLFLFPAILYGMPVLEAPVLAVEAPVAAAAPEPVAKALRPTEAALSAEMLEQLGGAINRYMEAERPWLQPQFALGTLAAALQVPQHQLSWYFNHYLGMSFPAFRNQYRVQYACSMIAEGMAATHNLEAIGQLAGFSGRTTFFRVFKEVMGMSPAEYQQTLASQQQ